MNKNVKSFFYIYAWLRRRLEWLDVCIMRHQSYRNTIEHYTEIRTRTLKTKKKLIFAAKWLLTVRDRVTKVKGIQSSQISPKLNLSSTQLSALTSHLVFIYTINLPQSVMLGRVLRQICSFSSRSIGSRVLLQWAVGVQQQHRRRLSVLKAEVAVAA